MNGRPNRSGEVSQAALSKIPATQIDGVSNRNSLIASDVAHEEMDRQGTSASIYCLDDATRDLMLVNARKDAAHAVLNTIELLRRADKMAAIVQPLLGLVLLLTIVVVLLGIHWLKF
jgi:hypothetical protein